MKNRPNQATRQGRLALHDRASERQREGAEPAEPVTPGAGDAEAQRGKATRSPADVATRRHLEGSEQGPS